MTVVDDHSRYEVGLEASLTSSRHRAKPIGADLPSLRAAGCLLRRQRHALGQFTRAALDELGRVVFKLDVAVLHSRPYHPQSRGKSERFHRTLKAEVFALRPFRDLAEVQRAFDHWRTVYNLHRPHQALD